MVLLQTASMKTSRSEGFTPLPHSPGPPVPGYNDVGAGKCENCSTRKCTAKFIHLPELPFGWEKVEDPHYGIYYIDHVNRRTQYENPVAAAKKGDDVNGTSTFPRPKKNQDSAKRSVSDSNMNGQAANAAPDSRKPFFTKNPQELNGEFIRTSLVKSVRGFGFTIIGGERIDEEFLQIKNVVPNGPAFLDGKLKTGDVLVYINNNCVLGYTHQDVVSLFQTIPPGETVILDVCRGYSLPFDPNDPNTEIVTTVAVGLPQDVNMSNTSSMGGPNMELLNTSQRSMKSLPDLARSANVNQNISFSQHSMPGEIGNGDNTPDVLHLLSNKPELLQINIVRGTMGFGFTIADSPYGQKVKQILDRPRCKNLMESDILMEINRTVVHDMSHSQIVQVLKECPVGNETMIVVQRGGIPPQGKGRKPIKSSKSFDEKSRLTSEQCFVNQPGAYFFTGGEQHSQQHNHTGESQDEGFGSHNPGQTSSQDSDKVMEQTPVQDTDEVDAGVNRSKTPTADINSRPKTPTSSGDFRPKTPSGSDGRPKTPTRNYGISIDNRGKPPVGNRPPVTDMQNRLQDLHLHKKDYASFDDNLQEFSNNHENNHSRTDFYNSANYDHANSRPPPGPRMDHYRHNEHGYRQDSRQRHDFRFDSYGHPRSNYAMQNSGDRRDVDRDSRFNYDRGESVKPGQFRSRTPGPELMNRTGGPDYWPEIHRPKTPTAYDMRSKTPLPSHSHNSGDYRQSGRYTPNPAWEYGRSFRGQDFNRPWPSDIGSPPIGRRLDTFENYGSDFSRGPQHKGQGSPGGAGRHPRQSTSFENEEPSPSNITRVPKRHPLQSGPSFSNQGSHSPRSVGRFSEKEELGTHFVEMTVHLHRQDSGFGFRIIGGTEEGSQVSVGHIVPGGSADVDGRLRTGDEITFIDGNSVINSSHHRVVQLMGNAALNGRVTIGVRRRIGSFPDISHTSGNAAPSFPYEVTVTRHENEGFGFVIISSVTKSGSTIGEFIGRVLENSPAERCGRLHVGDRILSVNSSDITHMHHEDIVNLIKDSGYSVTLTIGPPPGKGSDDASSTASTSQRSSQGSMINAMAYPAVSESDLARRPDSSPHHQPRDRHQPPSDRLKDISRSKIQNHQEPEDGEIYTVELHRGSRGFGFSIRGGREFNNMPLFVLRIAEGGAADVDGRLRVGDQILEINNYQTDSMTHTDAIDIIQNGGPSVRLLMKRTETGPSPVGRYPPGVPVANGPIGHSSPHLGRRQLEAREEYFQNYPGSRSFQNY